jgi:hypothetical protein
MIDAIHPSVIPHNNKYWMAYTPYPCLNDLGQWDTSQENPCILTSNDGVNWKAPCDNPLVPTPKDGYHSDPFLFFDNGFKIFYNHYYLNERGTEFTGIKLLQSDDGAVWKKPEDILFVEGTIVSPCIVDKELWYVKVVIEKKGEYRKPIGIFNIVNRVDIDIEGFLLWHFEVRKYKEKYIMLVSAYPIGKTSLDCQLFYAESKDKESWVVNKKTLLDSYKASFVYDGNFRVWYSSLENNRWYIRDTIINGII